MSEQDHRPREFDQVNFTEEIQGAKLLKRRYYLVIQRGYFRFEKVRAPLKPVEKSLGETILDRHLLQRELNEQFQEQLCDLARKSCTQN